MKPLGWSLSLAAFALTASAQMHAHVARWQERVYSSADGLAETACTAITVGLTCNVLVKHPNTNVISILDGYNVTQIPAPAGVHGRVYESLTGQLWTVGPKGLLIHVNDRWAEYALPEIEEFFRTVGAQAISIAPLKYRRVLVTVPDKLLVIEVDAQNETGHVILERRAVQTPLGRFAQSRIARDGSVWITGTNAFARVTGFLRQPTTSESWLITNAAPPEIDPRSVIGSLTNTLPVGEILDVEVEPGGTIWIATRTGLVRRSQPIWVALPGSVTLDDAEPNDALARRATGVSNVTALLKVALTDELAIGQTESVLEDLGITGPWTAALLTASGDLWLGALNGTAVCHKGNWRVFASSAGVNPSDVVCFAEAPNGRICSGTHDTVWEFDGRGWIVLRSGLGKVNDLCFARDGTLWVATDSGIHRFTRGVWVHNDVNDGLPASVVLKVWQTQSGQIISLTGAGFAMFNPGADLDPPCTTIQPVETDLSRVREGGVIKLRLAGRDKWDQTSPNRLSYSWRLDDREWTPFQENPEVTLVDLPAGKHYFRARTMDRNGNIDPNPPLLEFNVLLPWYRETRLVIVLSVALCVAVFFAALALNRHRKLLRSYAEVEKKVAERTRELELAQQQLLHSQKMTALGTLTAGLAHDFNNILSIIKGSAQIIEENVANIDKVRTRLERIKMATDQGAGIIRALLGFSRDSAQAGAVCSLNTVVEDTVKLLGDRFLREVSITVKAADDLPKLLLTRDFVQQILLNFIFNAAESMTQHKRIVIETRMLPQLPPGLVLAPALASKYAVVSVQDFGCGIPPEHMSRIFEPFFTTKAFSARRGTGLGLSMVYEMAKKIGAGLAVESTVGHGSTFTLVIPVLEEPAGAEPEPARMSQEIQYPVYNDAQMP